MAHTLFAPSNSSSILLKPKTLPAFYLRLKKPTTVSVGLKRVAVSARAESYATSLKVHASTAQVMEAPSSNAPPTIVDVDLGDRSYPIYIGSGLLNRPELLQRDPIALTYVIKRSCENKAEMVFLDEKESGVRATLNLGHTFGHAIETGVGYGQRLHGEVVAAGTVMAVDMSYRLGWIDESIVKRVDNILKRAKLPTAPPETMTVDIFKSVIAVDKKVADGLLRLILLQGPLGNCLFTGEYDRKALDDTLRAFCKS